MEEPGIAQGVGPQHEVYRSGPTSPGVQYLLSCALGEVTDGALGDAILEVGVDATEGELLARVVTGFFE